jgi:hypothetical protein
MRQSGSSERYLGIQRKFQPGNGYLLRHFVYHITSPLWQTDVISSFTVLYSWKRMFSGSSGLVALVVVIRRDNCRALREPVVFRHQDSDCAGAETSINVPTPVYTTAYAGSPTSNGQVCCSHCATPV